MEKMFENLVNITMLEKYNELIATDMEAKIGELKTSDKLELSQASETTEGMAKTYELKQGGASVGKIDIPKDKFVSSIKLEKNPQGQSEGQYIVIEFANDADEIQIAISDTGEISATVVAGSIEEADLSAELTAKLAKIATLESTAQTLGTRVDALEAKEIPVITLATEEQIEAMFN